MSATDRGTERKPHDFYATPIDCVENFINNYGIDRIKGNILEPSAGNGNVIQALRQKKVQGIITALELRDEERGSLTRISDKVIIDNFLEWEADKDY